MFPTERLIGGSFESDAVPINVYRTREFLDEDNVYNRQVIEMTKKKLQSLSIQPDVSKPLTLMTEQEKYLLNMHINRFLNEIDNEIRGYYNNVLHYNTGKLINYWNILCIYYKTNILKTYKPLLDSQIQGEPTEKVKIIRDLAFDSDYVDKNDIALLYNNMVATNYEPIRHILYSDKSDAKLTPYEETQLLPADAKHRQVIRSRNIPLGRPVQKNEKVSVNPESRRNVKLRPKRKHIAKRTENDPEEEEQETEDPETEVPEEITPSKRKVGRPRTKPIPDPDTPKRSVGRPKKQIIDM
jgi:hypothetical protein